MFQKNSLAQAILLVSCISCTEDGLQKYTGTYEHKWGPNYSRLTLSPDSTFAYKFIVHLCDTTTIVGNWKANRKRITLFNGKDEKPAIENVVNESYDPVLGGVVVRIKVVDSVQSLIHSVRFDRQDDFVETANGIARTSLYPIKGFSISSIVLGNDFNYEVKDPQNNIFDVLIPYGRGIPCENLSYDHDLIWKDGMLFPLDSDDSSRMHDPLTHIR